ncbi:hypothetical protein LEP1GSC198_3357 [Leptospira kirschneri str. JB]|nr:hypothetical protein LEP1GSC198_3357 [Leptospira kirschneri str. JB]
MAYYETLSVDERDDLLVLVKVLAEKGQYSIKKNFGMKMIKFLHSSQIDSYVFLPKVKK